MKDKTLNLLLNWLFSFHRKTASSKGLHLKPEKAFSGNGQPAQHLHHCVMHFAFILPRDKLCVMINLSLSTSNSVLFW